MKTRILTVLILSFVTVSVFAQSNSDFRYGGDLFSDQNSGHFEPSGPITYSHGHYFGLHGRISEMELADYIGISLYGSEYRKGKRQYNRGVWLTGAGAMLVTSALLSGLVSAGMGMNDDGGEYLADGLIGATCLCIGIPLWIKGDRRLNRLADDYNIRYGHDRFDHPASLSIGGTRSGFGLSLLF